MKIKKTLIIISLFLGLGSLSFILMKNTISENLLKDELKVRNSWIELKKSIIDKNNTLIKLYTSNNLFIKIDSLALVSNNEIEKSDECNLDIVEKEFYLNEEMLKNKVSGGRLNEHLNILVEVYNQNVLTFNKKYRSYPNRFFFKKFDYKDKEFFYIKYGEINKNPKQKKEDILNSFGI